MTRTWTYRSTQDKLLIFVSSRLEECKEERLIAHNVISSLNHQPVLFEHLGSRPYPPRDLYLSRLRGSQAMVAIYRWGYGYVDIANGMGVSGIEDEFHYAQQQGIPTLVYVYRSSGNRDPRLAMMIRRIETGSHTLCYYDNPEELQNAVRNDLTALITDRFLSAGTQRAVLRENSADVLARTLERVGVVVNRASLIQGLKARSLAFPQLCIYGPAGIGKTTLVAQFAQSESAVFVRVPGLAPKDLFAVCANALNPRSDPEGRSYTTLEGARLGLAAAWANTDSVTLVVDECDFVSELIDSLLSAGGTSPEKRVLFTSREPSSRAPNFLVPPLTRGEVDEILRNSQTAGTIGPELRQAGNPLHLQQALAESELDPVAGGLAGVTGTAGELLRYLALSRDPLTADDLLTLRADSSYSIEELYHDISKLGRLVDDSPRGFRLMHAETASGIVNELRESPQRLQFHVRRLTRLFEDTGSHRRAYEAASLLNDGTDEKYAVAAFREAARVGDWPMGVKIVGSLLERALDTESKAEALDLMLSLVYPLELMGDLQRASELLENAQGLASSLGPSAQTMLEETRVSSRARRSLSVQDVRALEDIYQRYSDTQQPWDQARVGLELSAIYIAAKDMEKARDILRPTLATFQELGDDYGADLAQRNLASALSDLPGREEEADQLVRVVVERAREQPDGPRQRAWMCNILTRRLRRAGRYDEAEALAKEAIEIGSALGDESMQAINLVNLGNVYRDQKRPELAFEAYEGAGVSAQRCGRRDIEADSSRLAAGILNDFPIVVRDYDRRARAKVYAKHAVGLLRGALNYDALARSLLELAEAQEALGEARQAGETFFEASQAFAQVPDDDNYGRALVRASHFTLPDHVDLYLARLADALGTSLPKPGDPPAEQFLALVRPLIERSPRGALIPLLTRHLYQVWSHLPEALRGPLVSAVANIAQEFALDPSYRPAPWRVLYAGVVLSYLLKDKSHPFLNHRLALSVVRSVDDVFVREDSAHVPAWTVILDLGRRVTVSISALDEAPETSVASFVLAMLIKAFEHELHRELIGRGTGFDELAIEIAHVDHMPLDMRGLTDHVPGLDQTLADHGCAVMRPSDFDKTIPTYVFLGPTFFRGVAFGEDRAGSIQTLFGLTLVELTFQLLRGQVEIEAIRPKVISLVRRTMS